MDSSDKIISKEYVQTILDLAKAYGVLDEMLLKGYKTTTEQAKAIEYLNKSQKDLVTIQEKLKQVDTDVNKELIRNNQQLREKKKAVEDAVKAEGLAETSLVRMRQKLAELTKAYDTAGVRTKEAAKEIQNLSKEIGAAESATNRHQRNVGNYASSLGNLPGVLGRGVDALKSFGTMLKGLGAAAGWIGLIVLALKGLYDAFTSTASGAKFIKVIMAEVAAIVDVFRQRAVMLIDVFKNFSWEGLKNVFKGVGDQMKEAAAAAKELVDMQSELNRLTKFRISQEADEKNKIQELLFLSKDKTKSDKERLAFLKEALELSRKKADDDVVFAKKQYDIDVAEAERKTKITGITKDQIKTFIQMGFEEQEQAKKTSKVYAEFYDKIGGSEGIGKLEESYARAKDADTAFFQENKRNQSQMTGLQKELADEREKAADEKKKNDEKAAEEAKKIADKALKEEQDRDKQIIDDLKILAADQKAIDDAKAKYIADNAMQEYQMQVNLIKATSKTKEEAAQKIQELDQKNLKTTIDNLNEQLMSVKDGSAAWYDLKSKLVKAEQDLDNSKTEAIIANNEKQQKSDEETAEKKKELFNTAFEGTMQVYGALFDFMDAKYSGDLQRLEEKNKAGLLSDKEYARKKAEIEIKQAKASRTRGIFEATIGIAQSVISALQTKPFFPLGLIMAATAGVVGGLQIASILSTPLPTMPAFFKGGIAHEGRGTIAEFEPELMQQKSGKWSLWSKPGIFAGEEFKGAKIYPGDVSKRILDATLSPQFGNESRTDDKLLGEIKGMRKDIQTLSRPIYDQSNRVIGLQSGSHRQIYLNRYRVN